MARYHYPLPLGGRQNYGDFGGKPWRTWHAPFSDKSKWQTSNISMFVDACPVGTWSLSMIASCFAGLNMSVRPLNKEHQSRSIMGSGLNVSTRTNSPSSVKATGCLCTTCSLWWCLLQLPGMFCLCFVGWTSTAEGRGIYDNTYYTTNRVFINWGEPKKSKLRFFLKVPQCWETPHRHALETHHDLRTDFQPGMLAAWLFQRHSMKLGAIFRGIGQCSIPNPRKIALGWSKTNYQICFQRFNVFV